MRERERDDRIKYKILIDAKNRGIWAPRPENVPRLCWMKDWVELKNISILDLEGFDLKYGWQAYLYYDKAKAHKGFHVIRKSFYSVWGETKRTLVDISH